MPPTLGNGKICYIEIPATDVALSADFYSKVFGWNIRQRGDGATAFDDTVGQVSGAWVTGRPPEAQPGFMIYIWVDSVVNRQGRDGQRLRDCATHRRRRTRDHGALSRSGRQCRRPLSGAASELTVLATPRAR